MTLRSIQLTQAPPRFSMALRAKGGRAAINAIPLRTNRLVVVDRFLVDDVLLPNPPSGIDDVLLPNPPSGIDVPVIDPYDLISADEGQRLEVGTDGKFLVTGPRLAAAAW